MHEGLDTLLTRAAAGDQDAWRGVVDRYGPRLFRFLRARCGSDELAEEIAQSVFCTVAASVGRGGYVESGRFEAWMFRVAINRLRDEMRRRKRQARPAEEVVLEFHAGCGDVSAGADADHLAALRAAVAELAEADREIIDLRHAAGLSFKQIAELREQPLGTVLARHHRALAKLRKLLEERIRH